MIITEKERQYNLRKLRTQLLLKIEDIVDQDELSKLLGRLEDIEFELEDTTTE